jgi:hypothetical protein
LLSPAVRTVETLLGSAHGRPRDRRSPVPHPPDGRDAAHRRLPQARRVRPPGPAGGPGSIKMTTPAKAVGGCMRHPPANPDISAARGLRLAAGLARFAAVSPASRETPACRPLRQWPRGSFGCRLCLEAALRLTKRTAASRYLIGGLDPGGAIGGHSVFPPRGLSRVFSHT